MANKNPIPGQFVVATLNLVNRQAQAVDGTLFAPIKWTSSDEKVLAPVGPQGGPAQAFEARGVGEANLIATSPGLKDAFAVTQTVEHPAGVARGTVTVSEPLSSPPQIVVPTPVPAAPKK